MTRDKNEEQRYLLTQKMNELEMKEDEFAQLMKHYEQSLEQFHARFQQLIRRQEGLLEEQPMERSQQFWADLDTNQELYRRMMNYLEGMVSIYTSLNRLENFIIDLREVHIQISQNFRYIASELPLKENNSSDEVLLEDDEKDDDEEVF